MKIHRGNFESNLLFLAKIPAFTNEAKILEVGSGAGAFVHELRSKGYDIVGTETNAEYRDFAKREFELDLVPLDGKTLPFAEQSFDFVVSFDVFEHIPDTDLHLEEVARVLKPGGAYLLATPNKWTNIPFEILKEKSFTKYKEYHVALHDYWEIQRRFAKNGFGMRFVEVPLLTPFFLEKMRKYLGAPGVWLAKTLRPDAWPQWLKTNFYIVAEKAKNKIQ